MTTYSILLGFTGTRKGLTHKQELAFQCIVNTLLSLNSNVKFMHGDCIGADADAHTLCRKLGISKIGSYPCNIESQRAFTDATQISKPLPPLERNEFIANNCDILIACPGTMEEELRSGTWSTIRRRVRFQKRMIIIWPDGSISENY